MSRRKNIVPMDHISSLSIYLSNPRVSVSHKLMKVCEVVKKAIPNCNRVGIWIFSSDYSEMISLKCIDENGSVTKGVELYRNSFQNYFDHILNQQFLVSSNARTCNIASCFNKGYFDVYNIYSLLDCTFSYDFKPLGIICCEKTEQVTEWNDDDLTNLKRIANLTSTFLAENVSKTYPTHSRKALLDSING